MEKSQLAEILRSFTKTEFREFGKYLKSPYFNNRSEVVRFYDALKSFYPKFSSKNLDEKILFAKVYSGKKFSAVLMRKLVSLLTGCASDFLAVENFKAGELEYNVKLLDILRQRKLPGLFEKKLKVIDNMFLNSQHSLEYHESKYKYTSTVNGYLLVKNEKSMVHRFQKELDDFIGHFLFVALVQYIRLSEWSRNYNIKFDMKLYGAVLEFLSKEEYRDSQLVSMYYKMLMLLNTGEEKYFFELRAQRDKHETIINKLDDYNIAIVLMQYCHKCVQKGDTSYRRHQFEITKTVLKNNLIPAGFIEPYFFTNIVRNATGIGEYIWCREFIENYSSRLNPEFAKETASYSLAMVEFAKGRYNDALRLLSSINIERSNMKIDIKNMLIMIYYELNYSEELFSLIDAYKHFLQRDKEVTKQTRDKSMVFVKFIYSLVKIKINGKNENIMILKNQIDTEPYFNLKEWLLDKIKDLTA